MAYWKARDIDMFVSSKLFCREPTVEPRYLFADFLKQVKNHKLVIPRTTQFK